MSRRKLPTAITLAAVGMSLITCVQAGEYAPYSMAPTVTSTTINGKEILIDVPAGKTINLPTGTRLWPASPIVISDGPVAEYNATSVGIPTTNLPTAGVPTAQTNQTMRVYTIKYSNLADGYVANPNVINPSQHVEVNTIEEIVPPRRALTTQHVEAKTAEKAWTPTTRVANDESTEELKSPAWTNERSTITKDIATTNVDVTPDVGAAKVESDDTAFTEIEETDTASITIPSDVDTFDTTRRSDVASDDSPENDVDLYADAIDPQSSEANGELATEFVVVATDEDDTNPDTTTWEPLESNPEPTGTIQLVIDEATDNAETTAADTIEMLSETTAEDENRQKTDDEVAVMTLSRLATDEMPMPVFAKETRAKKSELPWLLPFVFFSAIGLAWAERLRRNRAKARFERAMEHGRRVQKLEDEGSSEIANVPAPAVSATPADTVARDIEIPEQALPLATAPVAMLNQETPRTSNTLPPMATFEPVQTSTPLVAQSPEALNETPHGELTPPHADLTAAATPVGTDMEDIAFVDPQAEEMVMKAMDVAGEELPQEPNVAADFVELRSETVEPAQQHAQTVAPSQAQPSQANDATDKNWLQKMRDAEGNTVEQDVELDQLTGLLEDANSMRSEWAGFEKRSADFKDRWAERKQQQHAGADQEAQNDHSSD